MVRNWLHELRILAGLRKLGLGSAGNGVRKRHAE